MVSLRPKLGLHATWPSSGCQRPSRRNPPSANSCRRWEVAQSSLAQAGAVRIDLIDRETYIRIFGSICTHLLGESGAAARATAAEDFESDSQGQAALTREMFLDAVFEVSSPQRHR